MGRKLLVGPSHLSRVLAHLNTRPELKLVPNLKSLKLTFAFRNDHFGARHFVKEELPRIRWANPTLPIHVAKVRKTAEEAWRPEIELEFADGKQYTLDMHEKWSTTILKELMDVAGSGSWAEWKSKAASEGRPILPRDENEHIVVKRPMKTPLTSSNVFRAQVAALVSDSAPREQRVNKNEKSQTQTERKKVEPIPPPSQARKTAVHLD